MAKKPTPRNGARKAAATKAGTTTVAAKKAVGRTRPGNGAVAKSPVTKGAVAKGGVTKGAVAKGAVAKGRVTTGAAKGAGAKGRVTNKAARAAPAVTTRATSKGATSKGTLGKGTPAKAARSKAPLAKAPLPRGPLAKAPLTKGPLAKGARVAALEARSIAARPARTERAARTVGATDGLLDRTAALKPAAAVIDAPDPVTSRGKYVYCIVRSPAPLSFGPIGIGGEPADVYTVNWRDLAAVMSDSPPGVQDPTRDNVLAHQRVNETVMMEHTVLPMSFGTVFKTRDDIVEFLRSAYDAFADVLNKMENKLEFGLKVLWDRDAVVTQLEQEDEDIRALKGEIASQKGSTYFARMQYGRLVDAALQDRSEQYVAEIFDALRDVAVAARSNKPIGDRMILNAAFLVSRTEEPAFDARVKQLGARYDKLTFKYTGPWPPYNFVNIRLKLERA